MMRKILALAAAVIIACTPVRAEDGAEEIVTAYIDAFNAHDIESMMALVADDMKWMEVVEDEELVGLLHGTSVSTPESIVHTGNRAELSEALRIYFHYLPSARSLVRDIRSNDNRVMVVEEAVWDSDGVPMSQCATAVYEIDGSLIANVWYSSEQPCDD